ncbi:AAA family ATPase [Pelomonas sp. UHG3]|jgi:wobble nucleotide-excising tRNase|uniref:AAA family ATPase n=1 Tax=Roseateles hydrophilus TaxID=2975054 RepID=A0ACC6CAF2_9BURK|nr:AAA family ATPase [Pelomonas sp. UHG3]MCY4745265.1 AAA family ATPase [Pelomonas sp. UHG3]
MLTRIHRLRNFRIFREFSWPAGLHDFGRYNVIYGWNGSGKTTLSTLLKNLQQRQALAEGTAEYFFGDHRVMGDAANDPTVPKVRVFNREYVGRAVFETGAGQFPPVYYFGEDSAEKQRLITELATQRDQHRAEQARQGQLLKVATEARETFATETAKDIRTQLMAAGGAYNNFNAGPFKAEMQRLVDSEQAETRLSDDERTALVRMKDSRPLPSLEQVTVRFPDLMVLRAKTEALLKKTVVSAVVQSLADDQSVASWVGQGLGLHRGDHATANCRFCDQPLPSHRLAQLEAHFNDEFDQQQRAIDALLLEIDGASKFNSAFTSPPHEALYEALQPAYQTALKALRTQASSLVGALSALKSALERKREQPFKSMELDSLLKQVVDGGGSSLGRIILGFLAVAVEGMTVTASFEGAKSLAALNEQIEQHNRMTASHDAEVKSARDRLALDGMVGALNQWREKCAAVSQATEAQDAARVAANRLDEQIMDIERQVRQHIVPAEELTRDVAAYLGREELQFVPEQNGYTVMRGGHPAKNLSDGERTAVAFLYFLKSLQGTDFDLADGIVVIDDPVSSLDANSLFSAFGFLKARTVNAKQLFILTHNFSFFRQVRDWFDALNEAAKRVRPKPEPPARFFMLHATIHEGQRAARLGPMDSFLTKFESEYHYLFKRIFEASRLEQGQGLEQHYGLPNIARRMLESYLAYRVPGRSGDLRGKLSEVGGDDAAKARVLRFLHTYSHGDVVAQPDHDPTILLETPAVLRDLLELLRADDQRHYDQMMELALRD